MGNLMRASANPTDAAGLRPPQHVRIPIFGLAASVATPPVERNVEAAYRRNDLFERRRSLMLQWADYLAASA